MGAARLAAALPRRLPGFLATLYLRLARSSYSEAAAAVGAGAAAEAMRWARDPESRDTIGVLRE